MSLYVLIMLLNIECKFINKEQNLPISFRTPTFNIKFTTNRVRI